MISDYSDGKGQFYVCDTGDPESEQIRISFVEGQVQAWRDFSIDELKVLQDCIKSAVEEMFENKPEIRCSACGYTRNDADLHMDHKHCRNYPFFPGEEGKSHAIEPGGIKQ